MGDTSAAWTKTIADEMRDWDDFSLMDAYRDSIYSQPADIPYDDLRDRVALDLRDAVADRARLTDIEREYLDGRVLFNEASRAAKTVHAVVGKDNYLLIPGDIGLMAGASWTAFKLGAKMLLAEKRGMDPECDLKIKGRAEPCKLSGLWNGASESAGIACKAGMAAAKATAKAVASLGKAAAMGPEIEAGPAPEAAAKPKAAAPRMRM